MTVDALYERLEDKCYESAGCFECRGGFSTEENKETILDLFDYLDKVGTAVICGAVFL